MSTQVFDAVGRRKTATARVRIARGTGKITVNGKALDEYCYTETLAKAATGPLKTVDQVGQFDIDVNVNGGGATGQAGAISLGIARALQKYNAELRPALKKAGQLTRDGRAKERKKPGRPGARARFQFSKR